MRPMKLLYFGVLGLLAVGLLAVTLTRPSGYLPELASEIVSFVPQQESTNKAQNRLERQFTAIGERFSGQLGIAFEDVQDGTIAQFNGDALMPQQSVSKMWVALAALDQADEGLFDMEERATIRREDLTLFHQPLRKQVLANGFFSATHSDLLDRALTQSDNTANDTLLREVGGPKIIRNVIERKRLGAIRFGPGERELQSGIAGMKWNPAFSIGETFFKARKLVPENTRRAAYDNYVADPVDGASAKALASALARLARGELLSAQRTQFLLETLSRTKSGPNRLKGGLPDGWSIAHKTGTGQVLDLYPPGMIGDQAGYNDIAILTAPDGRRYAVAVMIARTRTPVPQRMEMMHAVVAAIAEYHYDITSQTPPNAAPEPE